MGVGFRLVGAAFAPALLLGVVTAAPAQEVEEKFAFEAPLYPGEGSAVLRPFIRNEPEKQVGISGMLAFPAGVNGPVPVVIVAHTSAGPSGDVYEVARAMRQAGFATLIYHSFLPRNFGSAGNASQSGGGERLEMHQSADAWLALKKLAADPRIDARRIAVVGTSAGGNGALLAASETVRKRHVPDGPRFAALVALYPGGYLMPAAADMTTETPILILPADKDDLMPWPRTKAWADYVLRENPKVQLSYKPVPDSTHSFLNRNSRGWNGDTPGAGTCPFTLAMFGPPPVKFLHVDGTVSDKRPDPSCRSRGATMIYSERASTFALEETVVFLKKSFAAIQ